VPRQDTSLRPHTYKRLPITHPLHPWHYTSTSHPTTPYLLIPAPASRTSHPTTLYSYLLATSSTRRARIFGSILFPKYSSQREFYGHPWGSLHYPSVNPHLGGLPIIASVSPSHIPSLFACLHESMSCVYVCFSTCLSICVLRAACLVFCWYSSYLFQFQNIHPYECRCSHNIVYMTRFIPLTSFKDLFMCVYY